MDMAPWGHNSVGVEIWLKHQAKSPIEGSAGLKKREQWNKREVEGERMKVTVEASRRRMKRGITREGSG